MLALLLLTVVPLLTLALVVKLDVADADVPGGAGPTGWPPLDGWLRRLRVWHAVASAVLTALILLTPASDGISLVFAGLFVLLLFARAWRHEFVALMGCGDDAFPGRHDKLAWVALMVLIPPLGMSAFRAYRAARRPAAEPQAKLAPAHDWF